VHISQFITQLPSFVAYLTSAGAEVMQTTNEWEVVRFRTGDGVSVVYTNAKGGLTFTKESEEAWKGFRHMKSWKPALRSTNGGSRHSRPKKASPVIRTLRERDGDLCFYCLEPVEVEDASVEHLVPHSHGGPSHLSNLFIAHRKCNSRAGHLSAPEKINLHVVAVLKRAVTEKP
jgi:5-methylcytosine-specific restriction endonuclease McrA